MTSPDLPAPPVRRPSGRWARLITIYQREIWLPSQMHSASLKGSTFAVLRVISITITAVFESRIASRAAALSFSSLLGLGPLIAIAVLVAGFVLGKNDSTLVADTLNRMIKVVAPQIAQYERLTQTTNEVNPQLVDVINNIITASRSSSAGALGIFSLLLIVLLLFKSIEDTFNDIWGVRQGRSFLTRIVLYWTILTLGAILFFSAVALLGAGTFVSVFMEKLPAGIENLKALGWLIQLFSFSLLTLMLTIFYRVIPNTHVFWRTAFVGGLVVSALLLGNNFVAFFYVKRVVLEKSLYGSLAIVPVLMLGLYVFWLYVLIGGTVSYAFQNVHFRNSQAAWSTLPESMRERLALAVFLTICRRFRDCRPPLSASDLSTVLKVPTQLLNECLNRLVRLELITTLQAPPNSPTTDHLFQPGRPLNRITLFEFKTLDDNLGENSLGATLANIDPVLSHYDAALSQLGEHVFFKKTIDQLFDEIPRPSSTEASLPTIRADTAGT